MRAINQLLVALCLMALLIVGIDWVLEQSDLAPTLFGNVQWRGLRDLDDRDLSFWVGAALMLLPILAAAAWVLGGRDRSIRAKTSDGGLIRLAPQAIERAVTRDVRANVLDVLKMRATARQGNNAPALTIHVAVSDRGRVPDIESRVRQEAMKSLDEALGVADPKQVKVIVYDIQSSKVRPSANAMARRKAAKPMRKARPADDDDLPEVE